MRNVNYNKPWNDRGHVHLFEKFGKRFVLDAGTGVVIELDEVAWEIIRALETGKTPEAIQDPLGERFGKKDVKRALTEISEFYQSGELFSKDPMLILPDRKGGNVGSICLIIAEDCNLRCDYCFTDGGTFGGGRRLMPVSVAKEAIDFAFATSGPVRSITFSYFGGEPLLNFPVVEEATDYALAKARQARKNVRFNITTNATLLNKKVRDFYAKHLEVSALFSIDGGRDINDRHRKFANRLGSYSDIYRNIKAFIKDSRIGSNRYSVRGTYTSVNHNFTQAAAELLDLGLSEISIEPAIVKGTELEITEEHLPSIFKEYDRLARFYLESIRNGTPFSFFHFQQMIDSIATKTRPMFNPCGAGVGYFAVAADGILYPCHRFVGDKDFVMGNVLEGLTNDHLTRLFGNVSMNLKEKCRTCWAKYHCGGGCHRHAAEFNKGDIHQPYDIECELTKYRVELGAYLYATLTEEEFHQVRKSLPDTLERRPEFKSFKKSVPF